MASRIQLRRDTSENWESVNPILAEGEIAVDTTKNLFKIGDGISAWNLLEFSLTEIVNDLITGGDNKALSAEQGKILKVALDSKLNSTQVTNIVSTSIEELKLEVDPFPQYQTLVEGDNRYAPISQGILGESSLQPEDIGTIVQGYDSNTAKVNVPQTYVVGQSGRIATVGDGSGAISFTGNAITLDFTKSIFFELSLNAGGVYTLDTPIGLSDGKCFNGWVKLIQPSSGTVATLAYASAWDFVGGVAPSLSTVNGSVDFLDFSTTSSTKVRASLTKVWS